MDFIDSPLGRLTINEADDESRFAQGMYRGCGARSEIFFSIKLTAEGSLSASADFAKSRMDDLEKFSVLASEYLATVTNSAGVSRADERLVWGEEVIFSGGIDWSILFSEGALDICEPYGVIVNFTHDEVAGYEDLSSANEI